MWMKRALAVVVAALVGVPVLASAATVEVDLTIAKTNRRIYAYGNVSPARDGRPVRVRLFHDGSLVATKRDAQNARGRYEVSFARPTSGTCEVKVRFRTRSGLATRAWHEFACAIPDFSTGTASITSGGSLLQNVDVLIADDGPEQAYGLMYRRFLGADKGMAFVFGSETSGSFYMKNTLIPLSIAFWDSTGQIVRILDMEPCTREQEASSQGCPLYDPEASYVGALEVNQGAFDAWGVSEGDLITVTEE